MKLRLPNVCIIVAIAMSVSYAAAESGQRSKQPVGSICIAPVEIGNSREKSLANPAGGNRTAAYEIRIDKQVSVRTSQSAATRSSQIPIAGKHLIRIFEDGKQTHSFAFRFDGYRTNELCLLFKPLYKTWMLWDSKDAPKLCNCT